MSEESKNVEKPSGGDASKLSYNDMKNSPNCTIHGQLEQKRKIGTWNTRWCVVCNGQFYSYKDETDIKPQVSFPLQGFQINAIQLPQRPFAFQLTKPGIEHTFAATEWTAFQRWMQQLAKANVTTETEIDNDANTNTSKQEEEKSTQEKKSEDDKTAPLVRHVSIGESEPPSKEKSTLHVSHSFDSAEVLLENSLHRSNEVEDLLSLQDTDLSCGSPAQSSSLKRCHEVEDLRKLIDTEDETSLPSNTTERSKSALELSFADEIMDPEAKALLGVSVEQLKQLFNNGNDTSPPSPKPLVKINSAKTFKRANSLPQLPAAVHIEGPLNVALELNHEVQWRPMWGTTKAECLFVFVHEGASQPRHVLPLDGVDVRPAALDTGRLLAVQLVRQGRMQLIVEPPNVEELGKWVSTLFHIIQQASLNDSEVKNSSVSQNEGISKRTNTHRSFSNPDKGLTEPYYPKQRLSITSQPAMISSPDGSGELVSVREVASLFETSKSPSIRSASRKTSSTSSSNGHVNNHQETFRKNPDFLMDSDAQKIKCKLEASYADVVCWLGPYMEQEEEKKVLNNVANPFLAKLRLRHKIEMISQLKQAATDVTKKIKTLEDRLLTKELSKMNAAKKHQGRLVRNAEDARRVDNEKKRIEKECASIEEQIKQEKHRLKELEETITLTEVEVKSAYQQIESGCSESTANHKENGITNDDDDDDSVWEENGENETSEVPEWTKKAKEKSQVWKKLSAEYN